MEKVFSGRTVATQNASINTGFDKLDTDPNGEISKNEYEEARSVEKDSSGKPVTVWYYYVF